MGFLHPVDFSLVILHRVGQSFCQVCHLQLSFAVVLCKLVTEVDDLLEVLD